MNVVLAIVIVSFLSQIYYAFILDICPCHSVAYFPFILLHICLYATVWGCQTVARVLIFLHCSTCICQCVVLFLLSFILQFYLLQIQTHCSKAKCITSIIFNSQIFFLYSGNRHI